MGKYDAITRYIPIIKVMKDDEYCVLTGNNDYCLSTVLDELIMAIIDFSNCMRESKDDYLWYRRELEEMG